MKLLKDIIINQYGEFSPNQLVRLIEEVPGLEVGIKWGWQERKRMTAEEALVEVETNKALLSGEDYIRSIFIPSDKYRELKALFGIA